MEKRQVQKRRQAKRVGLIAGVVGQAGATTSAIGVIETVDARHRREVAEIHAAATAVVPARAQTAADAVHAVTYLDVGTASMTQGVELMKKFREASRREAANLEFTMTALP